MKFLVLFFAALISLNTFADTRTFDRTWIGIFGKRKIADTNYFIWTEGQTRLDNDRFTNQQLLLRPGVLKKLDEKNEIGFLYGYIETDGAPDEHRPTFQFVHSFIKNETGVLSLRNRFEYRKREGVDAVSGRYRGLLRYQHMLKAKRSLIFWDEPFINMTSEDWTGKRVFERNRFFAGVGIPMYDTNFEIGYLNQYTPRTALDTVEHTLVFYFFY